MDEKIKQQLDELVEQVASKVWLLSVRMEGGGYTQFVETDFKYQRLIKQEPYYETAKQILTCNDKLYLIDWEHRKTNKCPETIKLSEAFKEMDG